jgi:hypothetical protein
VVSGGAGASAIFAVAGIVAHPWRKSSGSDPAAMFPQEAVLRAAFLATLVRFANLAAARLELGV